MSEHCLAGLRNWMYDSKYKGKDAPPFRPDPEGDYPDLIAFSIFQYGVPLETPACEYSSSPQTIPMNGYQELFSDSSEFSDRFPYGKGVQFDIDRSPLPEKLMALLAHDIPVEVGIIFYSHFGHGSDWRFSEGASKDGGHAIILTGYKRDEAGNLIFRFKNSWGTNWGDNGYGTIDMKTLLVTWAAWPRFDQTISLH